MVSGGHSEGVDSHLARGGEGAVLFSVFVQLAGPEVRVFPADTGKSDVKGGFRGLACSTHAVLNGGTRGVGEVGVIWGRHDHLLGRGESIVEILYDVWVEGGSSKRVGISESFLGPFLLRSGVHGGGLWFDARKLSVFGLYNPIVTQVQQGNGKVLSFEEAQVDKAPRRG